MRNVNFPESRVGFRVGQNQGFITAVRKHMGDVTVTTSTSSTVYGSEPGGPGVRRGRKREAPPFSFSLSAVIWPGVFACEHIVGETLQTKYS